MPAKSAEQHEPTTIEIIQGAIRWAEAHGQHVRLGSYGVACTSTEGAIRWEVDPLCRERGVSPLGAVLLHQQPPAGDIPDAICQALGVDARWLFGFEEGLDLTANSASEFTYDPIVEHGFESGKLLRISVLSRRKQGGSL